MTFVFTFVIFVFRPLFFSGPESGHYNSLVIPDCAHRSRRFLFPSTAGLTSCRQIFVIFFFAVAFSVCCVFLRLLVSLRSPVKVFLVLLDLARLSLVVPVIVRVRRHDYCQLSFTRIHTKV